MDYQINPAALGAVFMVPCQVVDQHIKLAGAVQLKVLLWAMRHVTEPIDTEKIAQALSLPRMDVSDALTYWVEAGLLQPPMAQPAASAANPSTQSPGGPGAGASSAPLSPDGGTAGMAGATVSGGADGTAVGAANPPGQAGAAADASPSRSRRPVRPAAVKPSREDVTKRGLESPEIAFLLQEAQMKFGRGLRPGEASTLVWLHDDEGMGVALILMLIEFAISEGRCHIGFIERTALAWIGDGITTIEQAEQYIRRLQGQRSAWRRVESAMGIDHRSPSAKELQNAYTWVEEWGFSRDMLRAAYEECVDNTAKVSMAYIGRVLENWHKQGISTPEQAAAAKKSEKKKKAEQASYAAYDWDLVQKMLDRENEG